MFAGWRSWTNDVPLIGGPSIRRLVSEINAFAIEELEVLIIGESGTGKELVASELHRCSKREGAFVPVNCAAVPHSLFEAEIFGARKGAYTDAAEREGLFSAARGGTLFLDEVGEISLELQAKLLRAVELKEVRPVGANRAVRIDVRVIAATNRDLQQATIEGSFRQDLYHRLRGFLISIPPLRQRIEDIVLFVEQRAKLPLSVGFIERLLLHSWPGNIRELDRTVQEAAARCRASSEDQLRKHHLHQDLLAPVPALDNEGAETARLLQQVKQALTESKGNVSRAAEALGMHRAQIYNLLRSHSINAADFR